MKKFIFLLVLFHSGCIWAYSESHSEKTGTEKPATSSTSSEYKLVWSDEFSTNGLPDPQKWSFDTKGNKGGWGNNEAQWYTNENLKNAEVKDGFLYIRAIREDLEGKKYTSARLITKSKGDWLYGKVEVRAKLPEGRGMWPAIWMLPTQSPYGGWPACGEIDIMENVGFDPYVIVGSSHTQMYNGAKGNMKNAKITIADCNTHFHNYTLEWDAGEYRIYVDSQLYFTYKNDGKGYQAWPFDQAFHLILNVAVGGNWGGQKGIDETIFPQSMVVDYVRVYQKK